MKNKIRTIIDIAMIILFIILMGYYATESIVHEILGTITFILFIVHNILNIKWYKNIFKGKYNFQRIFQIIINLLLLLAFLGMMVSGIRCIFILKYRNINVWKNATHAFYFMGICIDGNPCRFSYYWNYEKNI